jgi:heme-degrading monooxygenase HmoA
MPHIKANAGIITQINVFTVPVGGQQALIDNLREAVEYASTLPGWLSASLHKSLDGTRVINYAQSDSMESALAIINKLKERGFLDRNKAYGEARPGLYEVVFTMGK